MSAVTPNETCFVEMFNGKPMQVPHEPHTIPPTATGKTHCARCGKKVVG